ncbi:UTRA domain-containing protein [Actinomadura sp. CNU-125]|uniref:UTRA domain-containing protein n=1 Tax=Actinomadura sp. CNU-125 TaxID=1904961 RepID=UPI00096A5F51|nr:UTRA domain-containing protein [Actinomadura sp. CNU-125]
MRALGLEPEHEITTERAEPPAEIAEWLGLPAGEVNCLVRRRRLLAGGIPVRLNASWFPLSIAEGTVLAEPGPVIVGGVKSALAELGHPQATARERIVPSRLRPVPRRTRWRSTRSGRSSRSRTRASRPRAVPSR